MSWKKWLWLKRKKGWILRTKFTLLLLNSSLRETSLREKYPRGSFLWSATNVKGTQLYALIGKDNVTNQRIQLDSTVDRNNEYQGCNDHLKRQEIQRSLKDDGQPLLCWSDRESVVLTTAHNWATKQSTNRSQRIYACKSTRTKTNTLLHQMTKEEDDDIDITT